MQYPLPQAPSITPSISISVTPTNTPPEAPEILLSVSATPSVTISVTPSVSSGNACDYFAYSTLSAFQNKNPDSGEILYLISSSNSVGVCDKVVGINISTVDCSNTNRLDSISNLTEIQIDGNEFKVVRPGIQLTNSYYYELDNDPDYPCETNTPNTGDATYPLQRYNTIPRTGSVRI